MPPALFGLSYQRFFQDHSDGKLWVDDSGIISTRGYGCTKTQDVTILSGEINVNFSSNDSVLLVDLLRENLI